jgi:hypothetical protein
VLFGRMVRTECLTGRRSLAAATWSESFGPTAPPTTPKGGIEASTWRPRSRGLIRLPFWQGRPVSGGATCCAALCMRTSLRVESEFLCLSRLELTQDGKAPSFGMQQQPSRAPAPMCLSGRCLDEKSRTRIDRLSGSRPGRSSGAGPGLRGGPMRGHSPS